MDFNIPRTTTFYGEAILECQRSRIDSEKREPPKQTCSSTRRTTESIDLCELLDTEPKTQWQSMFIILEHRHRLLHVRALLSKRNRGEQEICSMQSDWDTYARHDFQNSLALLLLDRLQLTAVYYYRREVSIPHLKCGENAVKTLL